MLYLIEIRRYSKRVIPKLEGDRDSLNKFVHHDTDTNKSRGTNISSEDVDLKMERVTNGIVAQLVGVPGNRCQTF